MSRDHTNKILRRKPKNLNFAGLDQNNERRKERKKERKKKKT